MKKSTIRLFAAAMLFVFVLTSAGCTVADRKVYFASSGWPFSVMKIGPISCDKKEVRVYLANYLNIYGHIGDTDLGAADSEQFEEGVKKALVSHLARVCSLELYANEKGIMLAADEKRGVDKAAADYYSKLTEAEKDYMGVSERDIRVMYTRYAIAEKVYASLMSSVDDEVSEDEARIMDAYVIHVNKKSTAEKVSGELERGTDFKRLCDRYSVDKKGRISFGRGSYPKEVEEVCFKLENGERSDMIKTKKGYYFIECVNKYNKKKSEKNKEKIIAAKKEGLLSDIIEKQRSKYYSNLNRDMLDDIHVEDKENIKTDSFFSTLDSYISF